MMPFSIKGDDVTSGTNAQILDGRFRAFQVSMGYMYLREEIIFYKIAGYQAQLAVLTCVT